MVIIKHLMKNVIVFYAMAHLSVCVWRTVDMFKTEPLMIEVLGLLSTILWMAFIKLEKYFTVFCVLACLSVCTRRTVDAELNMIKTEPLK
jgi:hypothetical protein